MVIIIADNLLVVKLYYSKANRIRGHLINSVIDLDLLEVFESNAGLFSISLSDLLQT